MNKLFVAALVLAATSTAAFAAGGGARGGVYPAPTAAVSASQAPAFNSGVGGVVSATSDSGKAHVSTAGVADFDSTKNLFRHH